MPLMYILAIIDIKGIIVGGMIISIGVTNLVYTLTHRMEPKVRKRLRFMLCFAAFTILYGIAMIADLLTRLK